MEASLPHRGLVSGTLGVWGWPVSPDCSDPHYASPPAPNPRLRGSRDAFLSHRGWQWLSLSPKISVMESEVSREGGTQISNCQKIGGYHSTKLDSNSVCLDPRSLPNWQGRGRTTGSFPASHRHTPNRPCSPDITHAGFTFLKDQRWFISSPGRLNT